MQRLEGRIIFCPVDDCRQATGQVQPAEIALIQTAMDASYGVQKAVFEGLRPGISTTEVANFVNAAHILLGLKPLFVAVQFGKMMGLFVWRALCVDAELRRYGAGRSRRVFFTAIVPTLPRTYVFGKPTEQQRFLWSAERDSLKAAGFGPAGGASDQFAQIDPKILIAVPEYGYAGKRIDVGLTIRAVAESAAPEKIVLIGDAIPTILSHLGCVTLEDFVAPYAPGEIAFNSLSVKAPLAILYSSGTTGKSKCITHSGGGLLL